MNDPVAMSAHESKVQSEPVSAPSEELDPTELGVESGKGVRLSDVLSAQEIQPFLKRSDIRAWGVVAGNFALIALAMALPVLWLNPLTIIVAMLVLGGRMLGLAVINHDCAHFVFFKSRWWNEFIGHWVAGGLLNTSLYGYREYHLKHHRFAGTTDDPDLGIASAYPATPASLKRKIIRDLTGQTGTKSMQKQLRALRLKKNAPFLCSHLILFSVLALIGLPWLYLLWWASYLVTFQFITRLRFMGEHGVALDRLSSDARENTCTTLASWWERLLVAPNGVNFHLEHHLNAAVPCYRLEGLHQVLRERGFFDGFDCLSQGYRDVIRKAAAG
jgi:fatty acid desaturase